MFPSNFVARIMLVLGPTDRHYLIPYHLLANFFWVMVVVVVGWKTMLVYVMLLQMLGALKFNYLHYLHLFKINAATLEQHATLEQYASLPSLPQISTNLAYMTELTLLWLQQMWENHPRFPALSSTHVLVLTKCRHSPSG